MLLSVLFTIAAAAILLAITSLSLLVVVLVVAGAFEAWSKRQ
jgi:hypothetical protein